MAEEIERADAAVGEGLGDAPPGRVPSDDQKTEVGEGPVPSLAQTEAVAPTSAENAPPEEPPFDLSEEARQPARQVRDVVKSWAERVVATGGAGRGATTAARMATARALAELRRVQLPQLPDIEPVHEYLRRATSAMSQAAHDIERNRYTLHSLEHQLERLRDLEKRLLPEETQEHTDETADNGENKDSPPSGSSST